MIKILNHPLIQKDLTLVRDTNSNVNVFRTALDRIGKLLAFEVTQDLLLRDIEITTPMEKTIGKILDCDIILVPVMRAGMGLLNAFTDIIPEAKIGFIGMKRDEDTFIATEYYFNMPPSNNPILIILEIMVATGGSICDTISRLQLEGYNDINVVSVISAPEGLEKIKTEFPKIPLISASLDRGLNHKKYILPGLGDAGDRYCG